MKANIPIVKEVLGVYKQIKLLICCEHCYSHADGISMYILFLLGFMERNCY